MMHIRIAALAAGLLATAGVLAVACSSDSTGPSLDPNAVAGSDPAQTTVEIRAVHDGKQAYFLFTWEDPTRSLKQLPLIKKIDGWHLLHDGYDVGDG